jgi:hypothetical protein
MERGIMSKLDTANPEGKEGSKLEAYKLAFRDARHIFTTYKASHPEEAWECLRKILFDPKLK